MNVAARLEALAEPGGICISRNVRDEIRNKLDLTLHDMGEIEVKNILRPVRAFHVVPDAKTEAVASADHPSHACSKTVPLSKQVIAAVVLLGAVVLGGGGWWFTTRANPVLALRSGPSTAVLPLTNLSGDSQDAHFSTGLSEDIITALSRHSDLQVFARESTEQFGGAPVDAREVRRRLGAQFVLTGSIRRSHDHLRVTTRLVDAKDGIQLWSAAYDRDLSAASVFPLQDEITGKIVGIVASEAWAHLAQKYFEAYKYRYNLRPEPVDRGLAATHKMLELEAQSQHTNYVDTSNRLRALAQF